jgi:hypothetical protein
MRLLLHLCRVKYTQIPSEPLQFSHGFLFLVCTWRHGRHVGVALTKKFSLASIVRYTNMAAMSLSFYSLRNEWKPRIAPNVVHSTPHHEVNTRNTNQTILKHNNKTLRQNSAKCLCLRIFVFL